MEMEDLSILFPQIVQQFRYALSNLHMSTSLLAPVAEREKNPRLDKLAAQVDQSFYQMLRLVNQLSAVICITEYRPPVLRNRELGTVMDDLCARVESLAHHRGLNFRYEREEGYYLCAIGPEEMEQLFYNLISNAFKFTPAGGTVSVTLRKARNRFVITVADTGCGMTSEEMSQAFESYAHYDPLKPGPHGLGLGLMLSRYFAVAMGGTLVGESSPGKGCKFTLSLPKRTMPDGVHDVPQRYTSGFNRSLLGLADAMPVQAFQIRELD